MSDTKVERVEFRNVDFAHSEAARMVELIKAPEVQVSREARERITNETVENFANHINKGFLEYRKSVTEAGDFASVEWKGEGSIMTDAMGRDYIDALGGFTVYGMIQSAADARASDHLPLGLAPGGVVTKDIEQGRTLTYADVELDEDSMIRQLRRLQDRDLG